MVHEWVDGKQWNLHIIMSCLVKTCKRKTLLPIGTCAPLGFMLPLTDRVELWLRPLFVFDRLVLLDLINNIILER